MSIYEILLLTISIIFSIVIYKYYFSKKSTKNNVEHIEYLPPYETRIKSVNSETLAVEFRGILPNQVKSNLSFETKIFTQNKDGNPESVLSLIDTYQSPNSKEFLNIVPIGDVEPHCGSKEWRLICSVPIHFLQANYSGNQGLLIKASLVNSVSNNVDSTHFQLATNSHTYRINISHQGYLEEDDEILNSRVHIIYLAVAVAFSDGEFHSSEDKLINNWISRTIEHYKGKQKIKADDLLSKALKDAERDATATEKGSIDYIEKSINEIKSSKLFLAYEAVELLIDVMSADGIENHSETTMINEISRSIGIDRVELEKIKKQKVSRLDKPLISGEK